jgi:long-chain acyl-CoA synthetase
VPFASRQELVAHPQVLALYEAILAELNQDLARFEKIKKFILVPDEFSIANGTLTPTMKLKRRFIEQRYRKELDALYADELYGSDIDHQSRVSRQPQSTQRNRLQKTWCRRA